MWNVEDSQMAGECMSNKERKRRKKQMIRNYVIDTEIARLRIIFEISLVKYMETFCR